MSARTKILGGLVAGAVFGAGAVVLLDRPPDPTPLLRNTGSTLARVSTLRDRDEPDAVINDLSAPTVLAPGLDLGEVLRRDGDGPWRRQAIDLDRVTTPYIAATAICGSAQDTLVAAGNVGADLSGTVLLDDVKAAVPTVWRSVEGRPWTRVPLPGAPPLSSLRAIVSTRTSGRSERLVALGVQLRQGQKPFVGISDDCGVTWKVQPLPVRNSGTVAEAIWADENGVLIAGSTAPDETARRALAFWESKEGSSYAEAPAGTALLRLPGPVALVMRRGNVVTIAANYDQRDLTVFKLDGTQTGSAVVMDRVNEVQAVGLATTPVGVHFLSRREGGTVVELHRFTLDGERVDVLPHVSALPFRQLRFVGDGGSTMYLIGEKDDFSLQAWSITLPDTAS